MQGAQAAEIRPWKVEVQCRPSQLQGNDQTDREAGDAPEHGCDRPELDRSHVVVWFSIDFLRNSLPAVIEVVLEDVKHTDRGEQRPDSGMKCHYLIKSLARDN